MTYTETDLMNHDDSDDTSPQYSSDDEIGDSYEMITPLNSNLTLKPQNVQCNPENQFCFVLWSVGGNGTKVVKQGGEYI